MEFFSSNWWKPNVDAENDAENTPLESSARDTESVTAMVGNQDLSELVAEFARSVEAFCAGDWDLVLPDSMLAKRAELAAVAEGK